MVSSQAAPGPVKAHGRFSGHIETTEAGGGGGGGGGGSQHTWMFPGVFNNFSENSKFSNCMISSQRIFISAMLVVDSFNQSDLLPLRYSI